MTDRVKSHQDPGAGEEIRRAIAEQLHDGPLQVLVTMQIKLKELTRPDAEHDLEPAQRKAHQELGLLMRSVIDDLNRILRNLWNDAPCLPRHRARADLFTRLGDLCEDFRLESGLKCRFAVRPDHVGFDPVTSDILVRAVRELLSNARKHAQATLVQIWSELRDDEAVVLCVEDDGIGLRGSHWHEVPLESRGFGLWSIDQRLRQLGGFLEVESRVGLSASLILPKRLIEPGGGTLT